MDFDYSDQYIFIHATISSMFIFAERVPVTIHAVGDIGIGNAFLNVSQLFEGISSICLCFSDAYHLDSNRQPVLNFAQPPQGTALSQQQYAGEYLNMNAHKPNEQLTHIYGPGWYLVGQDSDIEWLSPTNSIPSIIVTFAGINATNGFHQDYVSRSFPSKSLVIQPYSDFASEQTNKEFFAATVVIALFGLGQSILYGIGKRKPKRLKIT
jgi:hypothetical protein